jgi:hypothetical protein
LIDERNKSSAYDVGKMALKCIENEYIRKIVSTKLHFCEILDVDVNFQKKYLSFFRETQKNYFGKIPTNCYKKDSLVSRQGLPIMQVHALSNGFRMKSILLLSLCFHQEVQRRGRFNFSLSKKVDRYLKTIKLG